MKVGSTEKKHLENYLGLKGWVWGGQYRLERYLYTLHRITGFLLILFFLLHIDIPNVIYSEYLVPALFTFHALNGLRLILQELGYTLGRPKPPVYPYVDALEKRRSIVFVMGGVIVIVIVVFIFALFI